MESFRDSTFNLATSDYLTLIRLYKNDPRKTLYCIMRSARFDFLSYAVEMGFLTDYLGACIDIVQYSPRRYYRHDNRYKNETRDKESAAAVACFKYVLEHHHEVTHTEGSEANLLDLLFVCAKEAFLIGSSNFLKVACESGICIRGFLAFFLHVVYSQVNSHYVIMRMEKVGPVLIWQPDENTYQLVEYMMQYDTECQEQDWIDYFVNGPFDGGFCEKLKEVHEDYLGRSYVSKMMAGILSRVIENDAARIIQRSWLHGALKSGSKSKLLSTVREHFSGLCGN